MTFNLRYFPVTSEVILISCIFGLVSSGSSENLAVNKMAYLNPESASSNPSHTVDGLLDTAGVFRLWLVVDLGSNYLVDEVIIDYLSWGGQGYVEVQVFVSSPILFPSPYQEPMSCYSQICYAGNTRRNKTFTCAKPLLGRFVKVRRFSFDHPHFRIYETKITGTASDACLFRTMKRLPDSIVLSSPPSFTATTCSSLLHCAATCSKTPVCEAVNFNHVTGQCELIRTTGNDTINNSDGWNVAYYV